jgi:hypothetical protein
MDWRLQESISLKIFIREMQICILPAYAADVASLIHP